MTTIHPSTDLAPFAGRPVRLTRLVRGHTMIHEGVFTVLTHGRDDAGGIMREFTPGGVRGTGMAVPYGSTITVIEAVRAQLDEAGADR